MPKKLNLLRGKTDTAVDIDAALAEYDVASLEASLATAQQRRTDLLLTGTDPEILAAEGRQRKHALLLIAPMPRLRSSIRGFRRRARQKRVRLRS